MSHETTASPSQASTVTYVVYRTTDGKILHIHESDRHTEGGEIPESEEERTAIDLTRRLSDVSPSQIAALRVKKEDVEKPLKYEVDVKRRILVARK